MFDFIYINNLVQADIRTTIYKRAIERTYTLKLKASRAFYAEAVDKYPTMAFSLRQFEDETVNIFVILSKKILQSAKLGISEASKHDLFAPYPVLTEKSGEYVAQFKYTIVVGKNGTTTLTGLPLNVEQIKSEHKVDEELSKLLAVNYLF